VSVSENRVITVEYDLVIAGILDSFGAAPHINGTMAFRVNRDGTIDYNFERDNYPWAEAYYYDGKGNSTIIFRDAAARENPLDLFAIEPNPGLIATPLKWVLDQFKYTTVNIRTNQKWIPK
jgi:hypothetical protein